MREQLKHIDYHVPKHQNEISKNSKEQTFYYCKCGKKYSLQGSCYNHIRVKHDNLVEDFYVKERTRGRPAKESQESQNLRMGYVPQYSGLIYFIPKLKQVNDNADNLKQKIHLIQYQYDALISDLLDQIDELTKDWFDHSKYFIDNYYGWFIEDCEKEVKQLINIIYQYSLLANYNNKENILDSFYDLIEWIMNHYSENYN